MVPVSTFIGREAELARLGELIAERRMVTVIGPGGIGKTRLAAEITARGSESFPHGARRCELSPISPREDIGAQVAGELGFASVDALVLGLGDARCLVVLDNCEHVLRATARLCETLLARCPGVRLLATSREPLGLDGEHVLVLGPLGLPSSSDPAEATAAPAVRLFADRARAVGARWDVAREQVAAVGELCRRLDGIPLAIELAASRARALTAIELLGHLDRRFELLRRTQPVGSARHGSLRAAIDTSYELLEPGERAFLRALGVFAGPFDAGLAHAVAAPPGTDPLDTLDLLSRLVDRSLVVAEQNAGVTRYRLLDSLRHYAAEHAKAEGEWAKLAGRFVDVMVAEADRLVTLGSARWTPEVLGAIVAQFSNLAAAIEACVIVDETAVRAFRLILPLWGAIHQEHAAEIAALCDRALERWPKGDEPARAEATAVAVNAYLFDGRMLHAVELARALLAQPSSTSLARMIAFRTLGLVAHHDGDREAAAAHFAVAEEAAAATGMAAFERELAISRAAVLGDTGDLDEALRMLERVKTLARSAGDPLNEVWAGLVAAHLLVVAGQRADARAALDGAEAVRNRFGYPSFEYPFGLKASDRLRAALTTLEQGWGASRSLWREVIDRIAASGDVGQLAVGLETAAALAVRGGDGETAAALLAAVPGGTHVTVLAPLFRKELRVNEPHSGETGGAKAEPGEALRLVRELLVASEPAVGTRRSEAVSAAPAVAALRSVGGVWSVSFARRTVQVRPLKGLDDLAVLFSRPHQQVHCLELIGSSDFSGDALPGLDERGRREYRARIRELQEAIDEAHSAHDLLRAERAEAELDSLVQQLSAAFGLSGRPRQQGSAVERARSAVTWRIRAAMKKLGEVHPDLGRHLENAVRTGTWCTYRPETAVEWQIEAARRV